MKFSAICMLVVGVGILALMLFWYSMLALLTKLLITDMPVSDLAGGFLVALRSIPGLLGFVCIGIGLVLWAVAARRVIPK